MNSKIITDENFEQRLKRCIAFRNSQNTMSETIRQLFQTQANPALRQLMNEASAAFCLADLAGVPIEDVMRLWVESMEKNHPHLTQ